MAVYTDAEQLYATLRLLVGRIEAVDPTAVEAMLKSQLLIRFRCHEPVAEVIIDARQRPLQIVYGQSATQPQLDIALATDTLHQILLGDLSLTKAIGSKRIKPQGPIWKTVALAGLFDQARVVYPAVLQERGLRK